MTILCDREIINLCRSTSVTPMLTPFVDTPTRVVDGRKVLSYGVTSYGYDARLSDQIKIFTNLNAGLIDPKNLDPKTLVDAEIHTDTDGSRYALLPPNSYMLGVTVETFHMPRDVLSICLGKSTMARASAIVNVTPIEPGFIGQVVIEISSASSLPVKVYVNEGIAQFIFLRGNPCTTTYADKKGKYQFQAGITLPTV